MAACVYTLVASPSINRPGTAVPHKDFGRVSVISRRPLRRCPRAEPEAAPVLNDAFRSILSGALQRNGTDALYASSSDDESQRIGALEETLTTAYNTSRRALRQLTLLEAEIQQAVERERRQVERLSFALDRCRQDQAYYSSLQSIVDVQQSLHE